MAFSGDAAPHAFASTRWSQVIGAAAPDAHGRSCLEWLCRAYWEPLRRHAERRGWKDAEDAVQEFWLSLISRGAIGQADQSRGRFRTWLLACLDHHLADRRDAQRALKRGGGQVPVALDEQLHEDPQSSDPTLIFDRAWATTLLARVRTRLTDEAAPGEARRRHETLARFLEHNGDAEAYAAAGVTLGMSEGAVKVAVHRLRARFHKLLREEVAQTLDDPTPAAIDDELRHLCQALGA
jgi:DNA-directed RNA polymerase specialized sigma24 family protein